MLKEKPIQKALDLVKIKEQIALCVKHLICPRCASDLTLTCKLDKDNNCQNVYTCTNKKYLQKFTEQLKLV